MTKGPRANRVKVMDKRCKSYLYSQSLYENVSAPQSKSLADFLLMLSLAILFIPFFHQFYCLTLLAYLNAA